MSVGMTNDPWLTVVGIGDGGLDSLGATARAAIAASELLVGGARHLAMVPNGRAARLVWRQPLDATLQDLAAHRGRKVVVLASGDPMCYGVGALLARTFPCDELRILPAPSAVSLVCARLGWALEEVTMLSLHGRPLARLRRHLLPDNRLILLSHNGATPGQVAALLAAQGFGPSRLWVFEHLDGSAERLIESTAADWPGSPIAALNAIALECRTDAAARPLALVPGLPDQVFEADGMLTKREIRAATLARLAPGPGQRLWDVGAGSGAIAIEWLRAIGRGHAVAIERDATRAARIRRNAEALGTPELEVVAGAAPACLDGLDLPDAVFIGGGLSQPSMLDCCWRALRPGGRLVANAVTLEGERMIFDWHGRHGGELVRLAISRIDRVGSYYGWRPLLPVTQLALVKS